MATPTQTDWHRQLLAPFSPAHAASAKLTLLCDPDRIYDDPVLVAQLLQTGFALLRLEDPVLFRVEYEKRFRHRWEQGSQTPPLIVLAQGEQTEVPYDLGDEADADRILTVRLVEHFPMLDGAILQEIDRSLLATLWDRYRLNQPVQVNASSTIDWLLLHLFGLQLEAITSETELVHALLGHHYQQRKLPPRLLARLVRRLQLGFPEWPLAVLWENRATFLRFVGERWERFIKQSAAGSEVLMEPTAHLTIPGPESLPFAHPSVHVYLDTLLLEGAVPPVRGIDPTLLPEPWMQVGVAPMTPAEAAERFRKKTEALADQVPAENATYAEWLDFAERFADWLTTRWSVKGVDPSIDAVAAALHLKIEERYGTWLKQYFSTLVTMPALNPVLVDKVAPHIARGWETSGSPRQRRALLVLDGMSLMQWPLLREDLRQEIHGLALQESRIFAFVPTITPVSRQSLFSGAWPSAFGDSIDSTGKEELRWNAFWQQKGAIKNAVAFLKQKDGEADAAFDSRVTETIQSPAIRILGLVLGQIDKLTHGTSGTLDSAGLQNSVAHWAQTGHVAAVVRSLLEASFTVWVTADHGHVGSVGVGKPKVGALAEERGERALVVNDPALRAEVAKEFPNSIIWDGPGLPEKYHPLLAGGLSAFTTPEAHSLSHGGISIEESIVPFIKLEQVKA